MGSEFLFYICANKRNNIMKKSKLNLQILQDFRLYIPHLSETDDVETRAWAIGCLGRKFFEEQKTIPEIMERLETIYHTEHHWFVKSINDLEYYIRYAFINGMIPEDEVGNFFHTTYNENKVLEAMNDRTKSETIFDGVWDLYNSVLNRLNYIN